MEGSALLSREAPNKDHSTRYPRRLLVTFLSLICHWAIFPQKCERLRPGAQAIISYGAGAASEESDVCSYGRFLASIFIDHFEQLVVHGFFLFF
jgi:hypothetical protein